MSCSGAPPASGKTHLLRATVAAAADAGRTALYIDDPRVADPEAAAPGVLVAVDDVDSADGPAQARLFTLYNALAAARRPACWRAACAAAGALALRDDLRTRLGWGLVYEIVPLADADKPAALASYAQARGFRLGDDAIAYLLAHGRRDMATLVATLDGARPPLAGARRPVTVPCCGNGSSATSPSTTGPDRPCQPPLRRRR